MVEAVVDAVAEAVAEAVATTLDIVRSLQLALHTLAHIGHSHRHNFFFSPSLLWAMTSAALSVDRARAIGAAGATLCAGATLLGRHSLLRPALIAAASILGAVWLGVEPDVVRSYRVQD